MKLLNMRPFISLLVNALIFSLAVAQFPPTPENVTIIKSRFDEGITISYKEVCTLSLLLLAPLNALLSSLGSVRLHLESGATPAT
jgi:hypothetical protein